MMNNFIEEYYQAITDGTVIVNDYVRRAYEMVIRGIEAGGYFYSAKKAQRSIRFIEAYARHHEGRLAPGNLKLELWQKACVSVLFGVLNGLGTRQFREAFIVIARKNGKTLFAAAVAEYMLIADGEAGARIYFAAPKLEQARICYSSLIQMLKQEPELKDMVRSRRTDVYVESTDSTAEPLAFAYKTSDGFNLSFGVCDEVASWPGDAGIKQYSVLKSSVGAREQPLIMSISTAGYENDGIYDDLMRRATAVLNGTSAEKQFFPLIYCIEDLEKWDDINELHKSNPNLGVSVSVNYLLGEIDIARGSLAHKREFLTKYCNIKQNSSAAWLNANDIRKSFAGQIQTLDDFRGCYAVGGVDLSMSTDLTAASVLIERGGTIYYFVHFFLPQKKREEATVRDGLPYELYEKRGLISFVGESNVDLAAVEQWFLKLYQEYEIYILRIGYDNYCAPYLVDTLKNDGFVCESVRQGYNLTGVINDTEAAMKDGKLMSAEDNDLMKAHWMNAALQNEGHSSRRELVKIHKNDHIDGVACLLDAMCMRYTHMDELGAMLRNAD